MIYEDLAARFSTTMDIHPFVDWYDAFTHVLNTAGVACKKIDIILQFARDSGRVNAYSIVYSTSVIRNEFFTFYKIRTA